MARKLTPEEKSVAVAGAGVVIGAGAAAVALAKSKAKTAVKSSAPKISAEKLQKIAEVAETAGFLEPGAAALLALDKTIQGWTKVLDDTVRNTLEKLPTRETSEISIECELTQAALPVSQGLKAVHYGTLRVVFRVLPRMIEAFLAKELADFLGKVAVRVAARKLAGFIPFLGSALSAGTGIYDSVLFYNDLEAKIHDVLGCHPNATDKKPMRWAINKLIEDMKKRTGQEQVKVELVHTRKK